MAQAQSQAQTGSGSAWPRLSLRLRPAQAQHGPGSVSGSDRLRLSMAQAQSQAQTGSGSAWLSLRLSEYPTASSHTTHGIRPMAEDVNQFTRSIQGLVDQVPMLNMSGHTHTKLLRLIKRTIITGGSRLFRGDGITCGQHPQPWIRPPLIMYGKINLFGSRARRTWEVC